MKKIIFVFFILLLMETFAYAQNFGPQNSSVVGTKNIFPRETYQMSPVPRKPLFGDSYSSRPTYQTNNACIFGSASLRTYADQMDKTILTEQDSFLAGYKRELEKQLIPNYLRETRFKSFINKDQILCAMKRIPNVSQNKKSCSSSNESGIFIRQTPCVTDQMVDYIHWGLNETLRCFGDSVDSSERKMIFKKLNHESAFGFFFQYSGGTGIAQLISGSQKDLFLPGYAGNNFMKAHVDRNPRACENFVKLLNRTKATKSLKSCEFISIGDGIGRSLIGGVSLYLHYRSDPANPFSAEKLLQYWGYSKRDTDQYRQARSYITLGMYNKGPGAVLNRYKHQIGRGSLANKTETEAFDTVMRLVKRSNFYPYIRSVENSTNLIFDRNGSCKI